MKIANAQRQRFVDEFLVDLNGTQAAIRAGYSPRSAGAQASALLKNPKVWAAVEKAMAARAARVGLTADQILAELKAIGLSRMSRVAFWDHTGVRLVSSAELDDADAAAVAEISETVTDAGGSKRIKLHDKIAALRLAGEHLGLFGKRDENLEVRPLLVVGDIMQRKGAV